MAHPERAILDPLRLLFDKCLAEAIKSHGDQDNGNADFKGLTKAQILQPGKQIMAKAGLADKGGDHHHRKTLHDHLIDTQHQCRACRGNFDLVEHLPASAASHDTSLTNLAGNFTQTQHGQPGHGRKGKNHRGNDTRLCPDAKEDGNKNEIGEMWQRLQDVEHRRDNHGNPLPLCRRDAKQQADDCGKRHRNGDG